MCKKYLFTAFLLFSLFSAFAQTYHPGTHVVVNDAVAPTPAVPLDARTMFYDSVNFLYRAYNGTAEVLTYLNTSNYRSGHFIMVVDSGGTLQSNGTYVGGYNTFYMFKDSTTNGGLVKMNLFGAGSGSCSTCLLVANNLSDLGSLSQALINLGLNNVNNTSDATKNAATVTLTNHTISGAANTLTNIPNSSLNNSTIGLTLTSTGTTPQVTSTPAALGTSLVITVPWNDGTDSGFLKGTDWAFFHGKLDSVRISNDSVYNCVNGTCTLQSVISGTSGVNSVTGTNASLLFSPTTGNVLGQVNPAFSFNWQGQHTFVSFPPIFATLTTAGGLFYGDGSGHLLQTSAGTSGQIVQSTGGSAPIFFTPNLATITGWTGYTPLSATLGSAQIYVGNSLNTATAVNMSGAGTLSNTGVLTLTGSIVGSLTTLPTPYAPSPSVSANVLNIDTNRYIRIINPVDFGADPTGVADATSAIQAAFTARDALAVAGIDSKVVFPGGIFKLSATLKDSIPHFNMECQGVATVFNAVGDYGDVFQFGPSVSPTVAGAYSDLVLKNFYMTSSVRRTSGYAINTRWTHAATIEGVRIGTMNFTNLANGVLFYQGINFDTSSNWILSNTQINAWFKGVHVTGKFPFGGGANAGVGSNYYNGLITNNCEIWGDKNDGAYVTNSVGVDVAGGTGGVQISQSSISEFATGVYAHGSNRELFFDNAFTADDMGGKGIWIVGQLNILNISNIWIAGCGGFGVSGNPGFFLDSTVTGYNGIAVAPTQVNINGGTVYENAFGGMYIGEGDITLNGIRITTNQHDGTPTTDIYLGVNITSARIAGCNYGTLVNSSSVIPIVTMPGLSTYLGTTGNPDTAAIFSVASTTQGSVPAPIMTATQMNAITRGLSDGLQVYNSTAHAPYWYENGTWTTPSGGGGGAVSSVSNSDGSLTISPTTGAVVGSLNTANANTWSAAQTFSSTVDVSSLSLGQHVTTDPVTGVLSTQAEILHQPVLLATTAALPTNTYSNGTAGVGATLTATANGALTVDGIAVITGNRILVKNEASAPNNGIYSVTQTGSGSTPYILTRGNYSAIGSNLVSGSHVFVQYGTVNANTVWYQQTIGTITVGSTNLVYLQTIGASGITTVGTIDGATPSSNGAVISAPTIYFQSASSTVPGMLNLTTQAITGQKNFSSNSTWVINSNSFVYNEISNPNTGTSNSAGLNFLANGVPSYIYQTPANFSTTALQSSLILQTVGGSTAITFLPNSVQAFTLVPSGALTLNKYGVGTFTGTPATYPAFNSSGQLIESVTPYPAALQGKNDLTGQTAAVTTVTSYALPGSGGFNTVRVGGYITVTAVSLDVIQLQVTWTDETSTSRTQSFFVQGATTGIGTTGANAYSPIDIRVKQGTTITVATVLTTGTGTITYDVGANITQLY
jgi:hypothetical protein